MLKRYLMALAAIVCVATGLKAQCTTEPVLLQEDSQNVVIYYHADQGNKVLAGQPASEPIYAHTGVLLSNASSDSDWKYAPTWGDNSPKYQLQYVSPNLWKLEIGDIRSYYGISNPAEKIKKLAFVFRNANNTKEGKTASGGDIFVNISDAGLQVSLESNLDGTVITPETATVTFRVGSTQPADLSLTIGNDVIAETAGGTLLETQYTFTEPGNYKVTATAKADGKSKKATLRLYYAIPSEEREYPGGGEPVMGAVRQPDGDVIFCIAAPGKLNAVLVGSWDDYEILEQNNMYRYDYNGFTYFWKNVSGLDESSMYMYYYLIDSTKSVGDPYARLVLDPSNDKYIPEEVFPNLPAYPSDKVSSVPLAIYQENINDYVWQVTDFVAPEPQDLIIYELLFRDFTGTEGKASGNGTVRQALEKIEYLKKLGVNAIEVLPIQEFNGNNSWGYNPNFYFAPDKAYGTPDDYKAFIDLCHENGIAVILDVVFNQADWLHPWYQLYSVGENPFFNATAPHAYSVLNDWNQGYPLVRKQWKDMLQYWLREYKVDGFRFDLVKGLGDNDSYANSGDSGTNAYNASRVANMREWQKAMLEVNPKAYVINENLAGAQEENEMAETGMLNWANLNHAGCQYAMGYSSSSSLNRMLATYDSRTWGSTVSYLESHDEQRLAYQQNTYGDTGVKGDHAVSMQRLGSAAAQMIMVPGAHMIWQFSEMGNAQSTKDNNGGNNTSPKKVDWALLDDPDNKGLYDNYCQLINVRMANPELFSKESTAKVTCSGWSKGRRVTLANEGKELFTAINPNVTGNLTLTGFDFAVKDNSNYVIVSQSNGAGCTFDAEAGTITVPANCYVTIASKNVVYDPSGVNGVESEQGTLAVYGCAGKLTVASAEAPVQVYSIDGRKVATMQAGESIDLPAGIYVAVSGAERVKLLL